MSGEDGQNYRVDSPPAVFFRGACTPAIGSLPSGLFLINEAYCLSFRDLRSFPAARMPCLGKDTPFARTRKLGYYQTQTIYHPVMRQFFVGDIYASPTKGDYSVKRKVHGVARNLWHPQGDPAC